jgi:chromosomal replication initiation ATPase DnaA
VVLLQSSTRVARVSSARHALWWVARHRFGETFAAIGSRCGRGHAAVVHGVRRVEEELRSSKDELMPLLERIAGAVKVDTKREKPPVPVAAFRKGAPTALATLADAAAEAWGVPLSKLFRASRRQKHCAEARWTVFWIAREHMALSLAVIARLTGKSAHTSVLFGVSRLQELIAADVHARGRVATVLSVSQNIDLTEATAFVNERSLPCTKD